MQKNDLALARVVAKAHSISDSEDSDDTVDPNEISDGVNGSQDLFADNSSEVSTSSANTSFNKSESKSPSSSKKSKVKLKEQAPEKVNRGQPHSEQVNPYDADTDEDVEHPEDTKKKPLCKRKSQGEEETASVTEKKSKMTLKKIESRDKTPLDVFKEFQPFSFFLTKVKDIPKEHNATGAMNLKDILSESMGVLKSSCHFNFMFDMPWLVKQYPEKFRQLPMLLVHGEQGRSELEMRSEAASFTHITLCRAPLEIPYGTHHTKMMFLLYETGMRVVIHTANLISNDWHQKTQGIWISPLFPPMSSSNTKGDSSTNFKRDLLQYMSAYKSAKLAPWERHIQAHDMTAAKVYIIGSVPGRHTMNNKHQWGHLKLKKVLSERGPDSGLVKNWPVIGQFSSIGSLGPNKEAWLLSEWGQSMSSCKNGLTGSIPESKLHLIFPSKDNIRLSLEGYNGGGCVPYSIKTASKQPWLTGLFSQWISEGRGRSRAVPHIKTYTRSSPDGSQAAWFLATSANLSKAAWGVFEKKGSQLMIRSYELGVLFLPQDFGCKDSFPVTNHVDDVIESNKPIFPLPYDLPPKTYIKGDRPWFCDVPCVDLPDTFGTMWCPPL